MDVQRFKDCMSKIPTSVSVVSCIDNSFLSACTISSLMSVSVDSSIILFVLKSKSGTLQSLIGSTYFSINLLSIKQSESSVAFSGRRENQKFSDLTNSWDVFEEHFPYLSKPLQNLD